MKHYLSLYGFSFNIDSTDKSTNVISVLKKLDNKIIRRIVKEIQQPSYATKKLIAKHSILVELQEGILSYCENVNSPNLPVLKNNTPEFDQSLIDEIKSKMVGSTGFRNLSSDEIYVLICIDPKKRALALSYVSPSTINRFTADFVNRVKVALYKYSKNS